MCIWIAKIRSDRFSAVFVDDRAQPICNVSPCFRPGRLNMNAVALDQRVAQAIRIVMQLFECAALWADKSVAEYIIAIASDSRHCVVDNGDFQSACCFAQRAGAKGNVV